MTDAALLGFDAPARADRGRRWTHVDDLAGDLEIEFPGPWLRCLLPLCSRSHECASPGKIPAVLGRDDHRRGWSERAESRYAARCDDARLAEQLARHVVDHGGGVGLWLPPGVLALDVDATPDDVLMGVAALPRVPRQRTGSGVHLLVRCDARGNRLDGCVSFTPRYGGASQIATWPTLHRNGHRYEWEVPLPSSIDELPQLDRDRITHFSTGAGSLRSRPGEGSIEEARRLLRFWQVRILGPHAVGAPDVAAVRAFYDLGATWPGSAEQEKDLVASWRSGAFECFGPGERHDAALAFAKITARTLMDKDDPGRDEAVIDEIETRVLEFVEARCDLSGRFSDTTPSAKRSVEREVRGVARDAVRYLRRTWDEGPGR